MATLSVEEVVSGLAGTVYAVINGRKEEMLYVKNIEAKVKKNKVEIKVLGHRGAKHKANGWVGSGSMTVYYATTLFRELMLSYMNGGKDTYFDIYIENADTNTRIGTQTVLLKGVNIDDMTFSKLDIGTTELDESLNFTFQGAEIINSFSQIIGE